MRRPVLFLLTLALPAAALDIRWPTGLLQLDEQGRVTALVDTATGRHVAVPGRPLCRVQTAGGWLDPEAAMLVGETLTLRFAGGLALHWQVRTGPSFAWFELARLEGGDGIQSLRLADLTIRDLPTLAAVLGAAYDDRFAVAVIATHPNVKGGGVPGGSGGGNLTGVTHTFEPVTDDAPQGRAAARFAATSTRPTGDGWSHRPRPLTPSLDLTGLQSIRLRVRGDGGGQQLKVQLSDGRGGYRDDYIPITFEGWREVVCDRPALNTVDLSQVTTLAFYYNGLPANRAVECRLDDVRALLAGGRTVVLEDFEDPNSELWGRGGHLLRAETFARYGLTPAGFALVACPRDRFEESLAACEQACGLPSPRPGGAWGKTSLAKDRSYLFITRCGEQDIDEVIRWAERGGFATVLIGDGSWNASCGHHEVNQAFFPEGLPSLRRAVDKFHAAGLRVGLHWLAPAVYARDGYVTPKPDDRLVVDAAGVLAADLDAKADFIPLREPPAGFPAEDGGYHGNGTVVRLGDELISYRALKLDAPYGLTGCQRGHHGTVAASHAAGGEVRHLLRSYGYYLFDQDTSLAAEVAANVAKVAGAVGADMVYWDGSERLQGEHWYYNAKLQDLYYRTIANPDLFCQGSSYSHWSWHIISRTASADGHGDVKGYLDERIPRFTWYRDNLMPLDCGWYYVYDPEVTVDQYDYILQKCLAFNCSISVQTNPLRLADHPEIGSIFDLCNLYERLRLSGLVSPEVRKLLAEPRREYRTLRDPLRLRRTVFGDWQEVAASEADGLPLPVEAKLPGARLGLQLRCGELARPGAAYHDPRSIALETFETLAPYLGQADNPAETLVTGTDKAGTTSAGVTQHWAIEPDGFQGGPCAVFTATSTRADQAGWAACGKRFAADVDLSPHAGLGFWLQGDGQGGKFKLQIRDGAGATDWYVDNSFTGWRYCQLTKPDKPSPLPIDYARIQYLMFYYNGLPANTTVTCRIGGVRALPSLDTARLVRPSLTVGGRTVTFDTTLAAGERLVWFAGEPPTVRGPQQARRTLPAVDSLPAGAATLRFAEPPNAALKLRVVQDNDETLPLPAAALQTHLPRW